MISITDSGSFQNDLTLVISFLWNKAIQDGKDPQQVEDNFKAELTNLVNSIQSNPFIKAAYGPRNPIRRAIFYFGNYALEYELVPPYATNKSMVTEIILAALVPIKSGKFVGAYTDTDIESVDFDDLFKDSDE